AAGCDYHLLKPVEPETLEWLLAARAGGGMAADDLVTRLTDLATAAEMVEAIDDPKLQTSRQWNLTGWGYDLAPWGVRFWRRGSEGGADAVILAVLGEEPPAVAAAGPGPQFFRKVQLRAL